MGPWLQIPSQVMKGEHQPADRVRLPKSLFGALPGNRSAVQLAITILNIGAGNVFKVRGLLGVQEAATLKVLSGTGSTELVSKAPRPSKHHFYSLWAGDYSVTLTSAPTGYV